MARRILIIDDEQGVRAARHKAYVYLKKGDTLNLV